MNKLLWIALAFILGTICAGCAIPRENHLTIAVKSVQSTDVGDVEFEVQYEVK